jgi:hypothetical protein
MGAAVQQGMVPTANVSASVPKMLYACNMALDAIVDGMDEAGSREETQLRTMASSELSRKVVKWRTLISHCVAASAAVLAAQPLTGKQRTALKAANRMFTEIHQYPQDAGFTAFVRERLDDLRGELRKVLPA